MNDRIVILDFGSQFTQLIGRRVRDLHVYCELLAWNAPQSEALTPQTRGIILSGGPKSIYAPDAPTLPAYVLESGLPILGICYGMQALTQALGGHVESAQEHEYGMTEIIVSHPNPLLKEAQCPAWMSHGDRIVKLPPGWVSIAQSANSPVAAMADLERRRFGLQFHPEVHSGGPADGILSRFVLDVCQAQPAWTPNTMIEDSVAQIRQEVGTDGVLSAISGGVDSAVTTALVRHALGERVTGIFIDTGLMRAGEPEQVEAIFRPLLGDRLIHVKAADRFFARLKGVTDPEEKRKAIGEAFIREFEAAVAHVKDCNFLAQGTIYPDVIESKGVGVNEAHRIKSHHNVGGLPKDMRFKLVEPLRKLFKDEVRAVGAALGLPPETLWRQPFPGPGLGVRCIGEVSPERIATLQQADKIFTDELARADLLRLREEEGGLQGSSQAFAVLLPVRSVGVMGDQRSYAETVALRAVTTVDFMTAEWARLPYDLLARASARIVNEVPGVNRVVYDISSKPPATIEWE